MIKKGTIPLFSLFLLSFFLGTFPLLAQEKVKISKYGDDSLNCSRNLTIIHDLLTENKKAEALQSWRWVFNHCPAASENIYIEGAVIFDFLISKETDSSKRQALIDTLMTIYDLRIKYFFKKEGYILGRKGVELYQLRPESAKEALAILKQSVDIEYRHSRPAIMVNYFNCALDLQRQRVIDTIRVYQAYDEIRDLVDYNVYYNNKDSQLYAEAKATIEKAYNEFSPCDELEARYGPVFMKDTNNVDQMINIIHAFEERKCNGSKLYLYLIKRIYDVNPCGMSALMAGKFYKTSNHPNLARNFLETAARLKDTAAMYEAHLVLTDIYFNTYHDNGMANLNLDIAMKLKPDQAAPYLLRGEIYFHSADECGVTELEKYGIYWIAADQYEKAKSLDPGVAALADEKIKIISGYFPDAEFLGRNNLRVGDTYNVICWIARPTTIKVKP